MKFVKLSALALSFAVFAASCTSNTEENTVVNQDTVMPATEVVAPVVMDTTMAAPATSTMTTTDSMMTPNGTVETTTTTTETK